MNKIKRISITATASLAILGTTVFGATGKVYNTSQGLVLRGEASKSGAPLATVANDAEVEIIEKTGEWYKVKANGQEGYLFAEYVKLQEEPIEEPVEDEQSEDANNNQATSETITKNETKIYIVPVITSSVIGTIPANTKINVEKTLNNWAYVSYGENRGWVRTYNYNEETTVEPEQTPEETPETVTEEQPQETQNQQPEQKPVENTNLSFTKGYINSEAVNIRSGPSTDSNVVAILILNTGVTITAQTEEWYKVTYGNYTGYIHKTLISETPIATSRGNETRETQTTVTEETKEEETVEPVETPQVTAPSSSTAGDKIVAFAKQYLGYSYVYGGTTPSGGFDCSGFVYYVFNSCGYNISRSLTVQAKTGTAVSKAELQLGDVIFFDNTSNGALGHVGIYIGDGRFIHAANPRRGVVTDTINSGYYNTYYHSARRIAN